MVTCHADAYEQTDGHEGNWFYSHNGNAHKTSRSSRGKFTRQEFFLACEQLGC